MTPTDRDSSVRLLAASVLASSIATAAAAPGTGHLLIESNGTEVLVTLEGPALDLVGFDHPPQDAVERETLSLASDNLRAVNAMIRLPIRADCRLLDTIVDAAPAPDHGEREGSLGAQYRFHCENLQALDAIAAGVFTGFPFLTRIHATYQIGSTSGEAVLTPAHPVVHLVPLH